MLYACDHQWWHYHHETIAFDGIKATQHEGCAARYGLRCIRGVDKPGLSLSPDIIHLGSNSLYQAMNIAVLLGCRRILLLGADMKKIDNVTHFFGEHPKPLNRGQSFDLFIEKFKTIVDPLKEIGVEVINCTPGSALPWFSMMELRKALPCASAA